MNCQVDDQQVTYVIPERTITGSVPQILEELDDMIEALQTVREVVVAKAPKTARPAPGGWRRLVAKFRLW